MQSGGRVKAVRSDWFLAKFWRENQQDLLVGMLGCERPGSSMTKMNNYKNGVARLNWSDGWGSARCGEQNLGVTKCSWHLALLFPASPWLLLNPGSLSIYPMAQDPISGSYTALLIFPSCSVSLESDPNRMAWLVSCLKGSWESSVSQVPGGMVSEEFGQSLFTSPAQELGRW